MSTLILTFFVSSKFLVVLYNTTTKFWVNFSRWYTLIQTEKFRMVLHDTVEKKSKKLLDPGGKKFEPNSFLDCTLYFELQTFCHRGSSHLSRSPNSEGICIPQPLSSFASHIYVLCSTTLGSCTPCILRTSCIGARAF